MPLRVHRFITNIPEVGFEEWELDAGKVVLKDMYVVDTISKNEMRTKIVL